MSVDIPNSTGDASTCENCGSHVSKRFERVMGDNDDKAHRCPECANATELLNGKSAGLDHGRDIPPKGRR